MFRWDDRAIVDFKDQERGGEDQQGYDNTSVQGYDDNISVTESQYPNSPQNSQRIYSQEFPTPTSAAEAQL